MGDITELTEQPAPDASPVPAPEESAPDARDEIHRLKSSLGRAEAEAAKARREREALEARLAELEQREEQRKLAEMSEVERAKAQAAEAEARAAAAEAARQQALVEATRARVVAIEGTGLLPTYRKLVTGDTEDEVRQSIAELHKVQEAEMAEYVKSVLSDPARATEMLGEELATRLTQPPRSAPVGAPTNAGSQPVVTPNDLNSGSFAAWLSRGKQAPRR